MAIVKEKLLSLSIPELKELIPFDRALYESLRADDQKLFDMIDNMPNKRVPYNVLSIIYGGKENEIILSQQIVRLVDKDKLKMTHKYKQDIVEVRKAKSRSRFILKSTVNSRFKTTSVGDDKIIKPDSLQYKKVVSEYGGLGFEMLKNDEGFLWFISKAPQQKIAYSVLTILYGEENLDHLITQLIRLTNAGKIVESVFERVTYVHLVTPEILKDLY